MTLMSAIKKKSWVAIPLVAAAVCALCYFGATATRQTANEPAAEARLVRFTASDHFVSAVAFSPDGKLLAAGQTNGTITLWDIQTGEIWLSVPGQDVETFDWTAASYALAFSSDGLTLASGGSEGIALFDVRNKRTMRRFPRQEGVDPFWSAVVSVVFGAKNRELIAGSRNARVRSWDLTTGKPRILFQGKKRGPGAFDPDLNCMALDPHGKKLAIGVLRHMVLLDLDNGAKEIAEEEMPHQDVATLGFSRDSKLLAGGGGIVRLWNGSSGKELSTLPKQYPAGRIRCVAFSPKDNTLAIAIDRPVGEPNYVSLWDIDKTRQLTKFVCHNEMVNCLAWSPDGKLLATGSADKTVAVWDVPMLLGKAK